MQGRVRKMQVDFKEQGHVYYVDGEIASISVTELLRKHGLAPSYSGISEDVLESAAEKGKEVHKDLENVINVRNYKPTTKQGEEFAKWVKENVDCAVAEQPIGFKYNGMILAGTADLIGFTKDGALFIADHKNTLQFHREYVTWQVSLLDYFLEAFTFLRSGERLNGKFLNWRGATKFWCLKYNPKTGKLTPKELTKIPKKEIEDLIEKEYNNLKYQRKELVAEEELKSRFVTAEEYLLKVEEEFKRATEAAKNVRAEMLALFEKQNIKSWESPNGQIKATYVEAQDRLSVDTTKLKKEFPQAFEKCQKISKIKPQLRIKVRSENGEEDD